MKATVKNGHFLNVNFKFPVLQLCPTFNMLFTMPDSTRNNHKTLFGNFGGSGYFGAILTLLLCLSLSVVVCFVFLLLFFSL